MKKSHLFTAARSAAVIGGSLAIVLSGCTVKDSSESAPQQTQQEAESPDEPGGGIATIGGGDDDSASDPEAARGAVTTAVSEVGDDAQAVGLKQEDDGWLITVYDGSKNVPVHVSADGSEVKGKDKAKNPPSGAVDQYSAMRQTIDQAIRSAVRKTRGDVVEVAPGTKDGQLSWKVSIEADGADKPKDVYVHYRSGDVL